MKKASPKHKKKKSLEICPDKKTAKQMNKKYNEIKEIVENKEQLEKKGIERLKNPLLLIEIIKTVQDGGVCGEEDTILTLVNKNNLRLVKGHKPTSSNTIVSDKTGAGKDVVTKAVCIVIVPTDKYYHRTGMSAKALEYWGTNKPKDWTWEGSVLYLEDPEEDCLKSQAFRILSSGEHKSSTVKDQTLLDLDVKGKPVIIVTSMNATIDEEGCRRWDALRIDTTPELTKKVISNTLRRFSEGAKEKKDDVLQYALKNLLKPYDVVFPDIIKLVGHMPSRLLMRTQVNKFVDYIKSSAVLHQYQREKDEQGRLIATWFDYDYAHFLFCKLRDMEGSALNVDEQELIDVLRDAGKPIPIKEVGKNFRRSVQWLYNHLDELKSKGIIGETYEFDNAANKQITKIYSDFGYSSIDIPSSLVLNGFNSGCENQNKEGFNGFIGFNEIYKEINKLRKEQGLNEIKFGKNTTSQSNLCENRENRENLSVEGFLKPIENRLKPPQYEKVQEIRKKIEDSRKAKYKITDEFLYNNFDKGIIDGLMQSNQLIKRGDGQYVFGG